MALFRQLSVGCVVSVDKCTVDMKLLSQLITCQFVCILCLSSSMALFAIEHYKNNWTGTR